jgi:Shedu protein SduA, C-terminal
MTDDFDEFVVNLAGRPEPESREERDGMYAEGRFTNRTYVSRGFPLASDPGVPARFVSKVFDPESDTEVEPFGQGEVWLVRESPKGRVQLKLLVAREQGHVSHLWVQRITHPKGVARADNVLSLTGADAERLIELVRSLDYIPVSGEESVRVDDALVRELFASPGSLTQLYEREPELFRKLITDDAAARDVVALQRRRAEVDRFRRLLDDDDYFDAQVQLTARKRKEDVWQAFFEGNPWILGTGLGGQLYTSWDEARLEQVVAGTSIAREGKRADALMRTSGVVRWLTFAEFKHHRTELLDKEYRPGAWRVSPEAVGGVAQAQATVRRAIQDIGEVLRSKAADGSEIPDDMTFLTRPRSFLVAGQLTQLLGEDGGPHQEKIRSFELFRRSLTDPEIVTFDELLARAEWVVDVEEG